MGLQKYFLEFNDKIRMDYEVKNELATKRDILLEKLRNDSNIPAFSELNLGSYSMFTGIENINKDYDIDVALRFHVDKNEYEPVELKDKIYESLKNHTEYGAEIKNPCVTVIYKEDGDVGYHVDLAVFSYEDKNNTDSQLYLARGKKNSLEENKIWEEADPVGLKNRIMDKFEDKKQRSQFRRIIRYLKRWKDIKFTNGGNCEPPGIGITLLAYEKFTPQKYDVLLADYTFDDLEALIYLVNQIKGMFYFAGVGSDGSFLYEIQYPLPVKPYSDVFAKMSLVQMTDFKNKISKLSTDLDEVRKESDIIKQCELLSKIFGTDFPVPPKDEESKLQRNTIPPSSTSGIEL